jgi:hypothetical protein
MRSLVTRISLVTRNRGVAVSWHRIGIGMCGVILVILAVAKIANGSNETVDRIVIRDPVFGLKISHLFYMVGIMEAIVGGICLVMRGVALPGTVLAWFATNLVLYRIGIWWIDTGRPCQCMAGLASYLDLTPQAADRIMLALLALFVVAGYGAVMRANGWWRHTS